MRTAESNPESAPPLVVKPPSDCLQVKTVHYFSNRQHPHSRKAVVSVKLRDLVEGANKLDNAQKLHKFKLLAGPRYDPDSDSFKISSEQFPTTQMNLKWCSDAIDRLIAAAEVGDTSYS